MVKPASVKKNYLYSLFYQILTMITPLFTAPYVSRVLGADGVGIYSYSLSCITYFTMFAALGTSSYGMREISRCRDNKEAYSKLFWEIELLSVLTTVICLAVWIVVIFLSQKYRWYFAAMIPALVATMLDISWFYTGHEKMEYTVLLNAICKLCGVVSIFLLVNDKNDLIIYILINSFVLMIGNISMWFFLPEFLDGVYFRNLNIKKHFKETLVYFVPTIAMSIYTVLDKTLIGIITRDEYENGYYEQANKIINMAKTVVFVSVNKVMEARISYLFAENRIDEIKEKIDKSFSYILLLAYGSLFGVIAVAKDFVPVFFGKGYEPVIPLLYCMSPLVVIIGVSNCLGAHYYTPAGLRKKSAKFLITGSIVNLISNIVLIPMYKSAGAVIGSIIAEMVISYLYLKNCNNYLTIKRIVVLSYKRIIAGFAMMFVINLLSRIETSRILVLFIEIVVGIFVYFVALLFMKDKFLCDGIHTLIEKYSKTEMKF